MTEKVSYAQYGEDILLSALLNEVTHGFYVDVGANYESRDSVTKYFYKNGWSGINIEPIPRLFNDLEKKRKRDINLNIGVSRKRQTLLFREFESHGHSTFSKEVAEGEPAPALTEYEIQTEPLSDIFKRYKVTTIHFLKIDVEGLEYDVVSSNKWDKYRPYIVCIESNHVSKDWRPLLNQAGYKLFIADGLNEYYVAQERWDSLTADFAERAVKVRASFLRKDQHDVFREQMNRLRELDGRLSKAANSIVEKDAIIHELQATSYVGRPLRSRIKLALNSIFIDWVNVKRHKP